MRVKHDRFPLVVDHAYIWVSKDAPEMQVLRQIGLQPREKISVHTGQGTASLSIPFKNMYLELVWIENEPELATYLAGGGDAFPVRETWKETGVSPFGVGFHYRTLDTEHFAFETTHHQAEWMPEDSYIQGIPQPSLYLPMFFILHGSLAYWESRMAAEGHALGVEHVTELQLTATTLDNPDALSPYLAEHDAITVKQGDYPLMELSFDNKRQGKTFDLRPTLPLIMYC